jgi:cobalt-zinc-cadmium efflux system membrane fusion protein
LYRAGTETGTYFIIAPKDGYIVQKNMSVGQTISLDGDPLFALSNLKEVWVMVNIFASNLSYIKEGSPVSVRTIAYPDHFYNGKIDKIYNVFDENEHVLKARVVLQNNDLKLLPGLSADIFVDKNIAAHKAIAIPKSALIFNDDKYFVVVYVNDKHMEIRRVKPIAENEQFSYTNEGVKEGEKIISDNALLIFEELNNK